MQLGPRRQGWQHNFMQLPAHFIRGAYIAAKLVTSGSSKHPVWGASIAAKLVTSGSSKHPMRGAAIAANRVTSGSYKHPMWGRSQPALAHVPVQLRLARTAANEGRFPRSSPSWLKMLAVTRPKLQGSRTLSRSSSTLAERLSVFAGRRSISCALQLFSP